MPRLIPNWLDGYIKLHKKTEPAAIFDTWVGYSVIAAALRRKVKLRLGRLTYYTNLYVILVANPGVARKTQAIKFGTKFLNHIPEITTCADSITKEAMTEDIELAGADAFLPNGDNLRHSSLNIISNEFESFLGQKKENTKMLVALTDLFDCPSDWGSRTKHSGSSKIVRPWINLLAATTPDSLASSLPASAIGGGLTSRILFVYAEKKKGRFTAPTLSSEDKILEQALKDDLYEISQITGDYIMSTECFNKWDEWYLNYNEDEGGDRICMDSAFSSWYSRKPVYIMKLSMLRAAATSNNLTIEWYHVEEAIKAIEQIEHVMGNAFKAIGKSEITSEVATVQELIKKHGAISEKDLMSIIWRDIDMAKFDNVIGTIIATGKAYRDYKNPQGVVGSGTWYYWTNTSQ